MLLFVHILVHPLVHGICTTTAPIAGVSSGSGTSDVTKNGDQCELCRVGHSTLATTQLPETDHLNPGWIKTALQAVNYSSLQADLRLPSRAPPTL